MFGVGQPLKLAIQDKNTHGTGEEARGGRCLGFQCFFRFCPDGLVLHPNITPWFLKCPLDANHPASPSTDGSQVQAH